MRLDPDVVREILMTVEDAPPGKNIEPKDFNSTIDKYILGEHVRLLEKAGMIDAAIAPGHRGLTEHFVILRLEMSGHNFIANARNEVVWKKAMAYIKERGGSVAMEMLSAIVQHFAKSAMGL